MQTYLLREPALAADSGAPNGSRTTATVQGPHGREGEVAVHRAQLENEIQAFVQTLAPTDEERRVKSQAYKHVEAACKAALTTPSMRVMPFGSYANGLEAFNSDIDVCVTGIMQPLADKGGFLKWQKIEVNKHLNTIVQKLRAKGCVSRLFVVRTSRIPIIKCMTLEGVEVDISLNDEGGPRAARMLREQVQAHPALRPLLFVLKALLKAHDLNDVSTGGLGSFALANMVIAYLQEAAKEGLEESDLGTLLVSCLWCFGRRLRCDTTAVAIGRGGFVDKWDVPAAHQELERAEGDVASQKLKLVIEDSLTGRNISGGTHRMEQVQAVFASAALRLKDALSKPKVPARLLDLLFSVEEATRRGKGRPRQAAALPPAASHPPPPVGSKRKRPADAEEPASRPRPQAPGQRRVVGVHQPPAWRRTVPTQREGFSQQQGSSSAALPAPVHLRFQEQDWAPPPQPLGNAGFYGGPAGSAPVGRRTFQALPQAVPVSPVPFHRRQAMPHPSSPMQYGHAPPVGVPPTDLRQVHAALPPALQQQLPHGPRYEAGSSWHGPQQQRGQQLRDRHNGGYQAGNGRGWQ